MVVESTFAEAVLLETVLLSILNHDSAIASAASRMTWAADGRPCIEMGSRRTHEEAAVASARAAYIAGFVDHLQPRRPAAVRHPDRRHQRAQLHAAARHRAGRVHRAGDSLGKGTTLLVDTYDVAEAVRLGVEIAGPELGAVRLDSGDLGAARPAGPRAARQPRRHEDPDHRHLRPRRVRDRRARRGAGRRVRRRHVAGHRQRPPDLRVRLQAGRPGGRRAARWSTSRRRARTRSRSAAASTPCAGATPTGCAEAEVVGIGEPPVDDGDDRSLLVPLVRHGEVVGRESLDGEPRRGTRPPAPSCRSRPASSPVVSR